MKRWIPAFAVLGAIGLCGASKVDVASAADNPYTISLLPGLTTDSFYITIPPGAEAAAKDLGITLVFQGAPDFNPVTQVPVLNAIIGRKPDAILIAPADKG